MLREIVSFVMLSALSAFGCSHPADQPVNDPGGGSLPTTLTEGTPAKRSDGGDLDRTKDSDVRGPNDALRTSDPLKNNR
jgi:hypothetical protein